MIVEVVLGCVKAASGSTAFETLPPAPADRELLVVGRNPARLRRSSVTKRPILRDEDGAEALKKRTLTNPYNARPQSLADAHDALDAAVPAAYGWSADISDEDALRELLALNGGDV